MITAKNYVAQAERDLQTAAAALRNLNMNMDAAVNEVHATMLRSCVKFAIPDGGMIFDDDLRGLKGVEFYLPYDSIAVEYFIPDGGTGDGINTPFGKADASIGVRKRIALAHVMEFSFLEWGSGKSISKLLAPMFWENGEDRCISIKYLDYSEEAGMWILGVSQCLLPLSAHMVKDNLKYAASVIPLLPEMWDSIVAAYGQKQAMANACQDMSSQVRVIFELCEALSCSNVAPAIHQSADPKVNARRVKAGKLPIYETKVLTIKPTTSVSNGSSGHLIGERNSPRQHLRRGHIRRLPTGKNIWVQSCVVGSLQNGLISKSYDVVSGRDGRTVEAAEIP